MEKAAWQLHCITPALTTKEDAAADILLIDVIKYEPY